MATMPTRKKQRNELIVSGQRAGGWMGGRTTSGRWCGCGWGGGCLVAQVPDPVAEGPTRCPLTAPVTRAAGSLADHVALC
jgi:hypothetical protein